MSFDDGSEKEQDAQSDRGHNRDSPDCCYGGQPDVQYLDVAVGMAAP